MPQSTLYKNQGMVMVKILDRNFELSYPKELIAERVKNVAERLNQDYGGKNPVMVCILNGAFMFASDLVRYLTFQPEVVFAKVSSYEGMSSTGCVKELIGVNVDVRARDVIVVEDIVDTGVTMYNLLPQFFSKGAASVKVCTLLQKPECLTVPLKVDYCAMEIPNAFIVGYGLDYNGMGRNYGDIYTVTE